MCVCVEGDRGWGVQKVGRGGTVHLHSSLFFSSPPIPVDWRRRSTAITLCSVDEFFFLFFSRPHDLVRRD